MAEIPGVPFSGSPGVNRARLSDARIRPSAEFGYLSWPAPGGGRTSASPAHLWSSRETSSLSCEALVNWVWTGLELPGGPSDYHFLLQDGAKQLWDRRYSDPQGLTHFEQFCHLDLVLIEAAPEAVALDEAAPDRGFVWIATLHLLITMLEREGALREALALSRRAQRYGDYGTEELEARVLALDEELR